MKNSVYANTWRGFFEMFEYKPNFTITYIEDYQYGDKLMKIEMMVQDSRRPVPGPGEKVFMVPVTTTIMLEPWISEKYAIDFVRHIIRKIEEHEMDEWFRYKGELPFDPHKELS